MHPEARRRGYLEVSVLHHERLYHEVILNDMGDTDRMFNSGERGSLMGLKYLADAREYTMLDPERVTGHFGHERSLHESLADGAAGDEGIE